MSSFDRMVETEFSRRLDKQMRTNPEGSPIPVASAITKCSPTLKEVRKYGEYIRKSHTLWVTVIGKTFTNHSFMQTSKTLEQAIYLLDTDGIYD